MSDLVMKASSELSAAIPALWSAAFYPTLVAQLPFIDSVSKDYEGEIQALGNTVNVSKFPQFDLAQEIAEDERVDADSVTVAQSQLVINKQIVKDYILTKKALAQSIDSSAKLRELAMHSVMRKMQQVIIAEIVPNASAPDHSIAYTSGSVLALADILAAKKLLDAQNVPDDGSRMMILDTPQANDLFNIVGFTSRDFIPAGSPLTEGAVRSPVLGFNMKMTTETSGVSYLFHPQFLTMAVQQQPEVNVYDLGVDGKRAMRVNMTVLFGVKQLDGLRVVSIG